VTIDGQAFFDYPPLQWDTNMTSEKKSDVDNETILMTLDQIGQTIDIMTNVVGRLRGYITEHLDDVDRSAMENNETSSPAIRRSNSHTLH